MDIAKVVEIIAASEKSFDDAVQQGVNGAAKTIRGIRGVKIKDWTAKVENNKVVQYKVTMDVAFHIDEK